MYFDLARLVTFRSLGFNCEKVPLYVCVCVYSFEKNVFYYICINLSFRRDFGTILIKVAHLVMM